MAAKQRNIFALKNFRGLDKENKLLKVETFRATDGFNFKIDSNVLKTRPSLDFIVEPPFELVSNDYIIDFYEYGDVDIYVSRFFFWFVPKNDTNQTTHFNNTFSLPHFIKGGISSSFDFLNKRPLFQEEKECLFIFGLNNIYVFSYIDGLDGINRHYFFYELRSKPGTPNVYINNEEFEKKFDDLPTPYVPTVILDNKSFDDVNLLSKKSYYKYFAAEPSSSTLETTYYIPTYYDKDKHGTFDITKPEQFKVDFYKNRYENFTTYPIFLGVLNETFFVTSPNTVSSLFGTEITGAAIGDGKTNNFKGIEGVYYSKVKFLFTGKPNQSPIAVERIIGLTKNEFFEMKVKDSNGKTVFEFLMDYIKTNQSSLTANKHVVFSLLVQYTAEYKDLATDFITDVSVHQATFNIYVQLKSDEVVSINFDNVSIYSNTSTTTNLGESYLPLPTLILGFNFTEPIDLTLSLGNTPILLTNNDASFTDEFKTLAESKVSLAEAQYANGDKVRVDGYLYKIRTIQQQKEAVIPATSSSIGLSGKTFIDSSGSWLTNSVGPRNPVPASNEYPTINFPSPVQGVPQIDLGIYGEVNAFTYNFTFAENTSERSGLRQAILNVIGVNTTLTSNAVNGAGTAWFRVRMFKKIFNTMGAGGVPNYNYQATTVLVLASYKLQTSVEQQERHSMSYLCDIVETTRPIEEVLFSTKFNEENNTVELTVKNYFYDYKNEPTILVTIDFPLNTEYNYISESNFGVNFGSENRLFLAGNQKFPNIDRYNISNDLLGNGVANQSYELTYFPSKNYRVVGGKGPINGYVVATDTQLYVTKEDYPNDNKLFVRQRNVDNGVVFYSDIKTSLDKTPLNNRCIVRFYNDIVILDKNGLYGIELSQNVLTDERLVKLRSGFINEELKQKIAAYDKNKIFITENNIELQIHIGQEAYVADSKYIAQNPNSAAENVSYEIVKWVFPITFEHGYVKNGTVYLFPQNARFVYTYGTENFDQVYERILTGSFNLVYLDGTLSTFVLNSTILPKSTPQAKIDALVFTVETPLYRVVGYQNTDYTFNTTSNVFTLINNTNAFAHLTDGNTLHWDGSSSSGFQTSPFTITDFESSLRTTFTYPENAARNSVVKVYEEVTEKKLYITHYFWISIQNSNQTPNNDNSPYIVLSPFKPTTAIKITRNVGETDSNYVSRIKSIVNQSPKMEYITVNSAIISKARVSEETQINLRWISAITDFGISTMEKTSFRTNIFATKQADTNNMTFGYRTLRRLAGLNDIIDLSNNFNLENIEYSQFALATFNTVALSLPMKENNFLYIQFVINGYGKIEINGIEVIYKANRMIRSVA
jgi:hypothetical protein